MKAALIAAIVSALVASGGTYAATQINGRAIRPHSIPLNRLAHVPASTSTQITQVRAQSIVAPLSSGTVSAQCPEGQRAISGGYVAAPTARVLERGSWPMFNESGWLIAYENDTAASVALQIYAECIPFASLLTEPRR